MNKQLITELRKQAGHLGGKEVNIDIMSLEQMTDIFMEKFAELIVKECCDVFVELRTRPADLAVKDVKKHFGVEE